MDEKQRIRSIRVSTVEYMAGDYVIVKNRYPGIVVSCDETMYRILISNKEIMNVWDDNDLEKATLVRAK